MRTVLACAAATCCWVLAISARVAHADSLFVGCAANDAVSARLVSSLQALVTDTDSVMVAQRITQGIPSASPAAVARVGSDSICQLAGVLYYAGVTATVARNPVYVVAVGNVYVISDHKLREGENYVIRVTDSALKNILSTSTW